MRSQLPSLISLPIHTVTFCFPPPTLTTPSNPSLAPAKFLRLRRLCSDVTKILRPNLWPEMRTFFVERGYPTHLLDSSISTIPVVTLLNKPWPKFLMIKSLQFWHFISLTTKLGRSLSVIFKFLKMTLRRQPFSRITLLSLLDAIQPFEII